MTYSDLVIAYENENLGKDDFPPITSVFASYKLTDEFIETLGLLISYFHNDTQSYFNQSLRNVIAGGKDDNILENIIVYCGVKAYKGSLDYKAILEFQDYLINRINSLLFGVEDKPLESELAIEFKKAYSEFESVSGDKIDSLYQRLQCIFTFMQKKGCRYKQMGFLILAHYLVSETLKNSYGGNSVISSASVGGVSVSISQITPTSYWQQFFSSTKYGLEFLALRSTIGSATLIN